MTSPTLVVVCGLPGVGKSTIGTALARQTRTPYLRVDEIEQAIVGTTTLSHPVGVVGYAVAHGLAVEQLRLGLDVIVECVNSVEVARDGWVVAARSVSARLVEVEVVCADPVEHRRRIETRATDVEGLVKPTWDEVRARPFEAWVRDHLIVDSSSLSVVAAVERIMAAVEAQRALP
jgi:predicted kinase